MSKNANFVSHKKNKLKENGGPKLPLASDLVEGEIAINFGKDVETMSIKNESGDVVTFSSDNYYTEKKLGSGFTGENSGVTVTEALENVEITVDQVIDSGTSASTNAVATKAVYDAITDNELVWAMAYTTLSGAVSSHTENTEIHVTSNEKTKWNAVDNKLNTSDFNTYSGNVDTAIGSKAAQSDLSALSGTVTGHTADTTIHLTSTEKGQLHTHSNMSALNSITGNVDTMAYENKASYSSATEVNTALGNKANTASTLAGYGITDAYTKSETSGATELTTAFAAKANTTDLANYFDGAKYEDSGSTKVINFYHGNTIKATVDASDFIVDGMVDDVRIENGYLVIDFNTASGKQDISIPLTDIFDPSNYYNKTAIDDLVGSGFTSSSITEVITENEEIVSNALTDLDERKLDASAYTPTDLSNYYTKSETSGATEISNALGAKVNSATFTGHTADTSMHFTSTEKTNLDSLATNIAAISGITSTKVSNWDTAYTNNHTHSNKTALDSITGSVGTMAYQNTSSYSSATQVNTALSGKQGTLTEGRAIDITNNVISLDLPISAGTGTNSIIEGSGTTANSESSHAEGEGTRANGGCSHAEGWFTKANGFYSHSEGYSTTANGFYSHSEGRSTQASGQSSHAEGSSTIASGASSHAEGDNTGAKGNYSHAEGQSTYAIGDSSHAEGGNTTASGNASHAEGSSTRAIGNVSHAEGYRTSASSFYSHAEGRDTTASGSCSHAEGRGTQANNQSEHASGQYNVSSSASTTFGDSGNTLFSVGNGTSTSARHNAFEIRQNGDIYISSGGTNTSPMIKLQALLDRIAYLENKVIYNGHAYVEIGGLKWATMNVGANSITDYGLYFQWGDTQGWTSEKACCGDGPDEPDEPVVCDEGTKCFNSSDYKWTTDDGSTFTKYNSTDGLITLEEGDDAVTAAWGGSWRMPTTAEFQTLGAAVNTAWTADYQGSGVAGMICTDKTDSSKVLFFPACGNCSNGSVGSVGSFGYYWSSSLFSRNVQHSFILNFYEGRMNLQDINGRYDGLSVRGVVG